MTNDIMDGYETRRVKGVQVSSPEEMCNALVVVRNTEGVQLPPGLAWRMAGRFPPEGKWEDRYEVAAMQLMWPLWFKGTLIEGEVIVGEYKYVGPCEFSIPAVQHFEIVRPISFEGVLRVRTIA